VAAPPQRRNLATELRKRPRQRRATATVGAIVEAAARILVDSGPRALSTNSIARRAGVSVGSLYQYFPNKHAILRALVEREIERVERLRPALLDDPRAPLETRLRAAVDWHMDVHASHPELYGILRALLSGLLAPRTRAELRAGRSVRIRRTVASAPIDRARDLDVVAFVVDTCLDALTDAAARRAGGTRSEALRAEIATLLSRYLRDA
jgi:AcrR family transcriptional regulator